jgi:demethylmenaquinone methyltransferase/2-methoxy-6-polyprenyl-1,4-benzoquinol methylase
MELRFLERLPEPAEKRAFVKAMFDRIAPRYDLMNRLMTLGLDWRWRRAALEAVGVGPGDRLLDLATGTGDFAELGASRGAFVIGVDLSAEMLQLARKRNPGLAFVRADAVGLPLPDRFATVVSCGFSLRNFVDLESVFRECARLLASGGRLVILETDRPRSRLLRWGAAFHMDHVVPRLGGALVDREAYRYLPASQAYLPPEEELRARIEKAGFTSIQKKSHGLGAVQRLTAVRCER